jgi:hypothetical protein
MAGPQIPIEASYSLFGNKYVWQDSVSRDHAEDRPREFSYVDLHASLVLPFLSPGKTNIPTVELKGLTLLSISTHQDTYPVVSFGRRNIKGYTEGHTTFAGAMGFTILGRSPLVEALHELVLWKGNTKIEFTNPTQLPPVDLVITLLNQAGESAAIFVRSLKFLDASFNISTRDIQPTDTYAFMCTNVTTLIDDSSKFKLNAGTVDNLPTRVASNLFFETRTIPTPTSATTTNTSTGTTTTPGTTTAPTTTPDPNYTTDVTTVTTDNI